MNYAAGYHFGMFGCIECNFTGYVTYGDPRPYGTLKVTAPCECRERQREESKKADDSTSL